MSLSGINTLIAGAQEYLHKAIWEQDPSAIAYVLAAGATVAITLVLAQRLRET